MTPKTSDHISTGLTDHEYYTDLWGSTNVADRERQIWSNVRRRSVIVALVASLALVAQIVVSGIGVPNLEAERSPALTSVTRGR